MIAALLDIARSLAQIMDDETAQLAQTARLGDHAALGQAKQVLAGQLEAEFVKLDALGPDWPNRLSGDEQADLATTIGELIAVAEVNAAMLQRQLDLSSDLLAALTREARRASGHGGIVYAASGTLSTAEGAGPIALNRTL